MKFLIVFMGITLVACTSTGVVPVDDDMHMIAKRSAQVGFGPPVKTQAAVYAEASEYCAKQEKSVETVNLDVTNSGFGRPGSVRLEFRCEPKSLPKDSDADVNNLARQDENRYDQLREAKQLFDDGILTKEEYEAEKDRVLGSH